MTNQRLRIEEEARIEQARLATRRLFLKQCAIGLGGLALSPLLPACGSDAGTFFDAATRWPRVRPTSQRVPNR